MAIKAPKETVSRAEHDNLTAINENLRRRCDMYQREIATLSSITEVYRKMLGAVLSITP